MKKIIFIVILSTLFFQSFSQRRANNQEVRGTVREKKEKKNADLYRSQLSFYLMPGYSQLGYSITDNLKSAGSFSFGGGIGYTFWFNKYIGLGTGLQFNYYTGKLKLSSHSSILNGIDNSDGIQNPYILTQTINGTEQHRVTYFEIPLLLNFAIPLSKTVDFIVNAGGSIGFNMIENHTMAIGDYQRMISFPDINVNINSSESLHLGTFTKFSPSPKHFSSNFSVIGDVGIKIKLTPRTHLSLLATGGYGLGSIKAQDVPFVSLDKYQGTTVTQQVKSINTLSVGGKIALNIGLGKSKEKQDFQSDSDYDFPLNYTVPIQETPPPTQTQTFQEVVPPVQVETKPQLTPEQERDEKIQKLKILLKQLEKIIAEKKPKFGNGSQNISLEVQNILTEASEIINTTKTPIIIVCQSCKQATPKANKAVGGKKAQLIKKSFLDFNAENSFIRTRVTKCKTTKTDGKISFLVIAYGEIKDVESSKKVLKSQSSKKKNATTKAKSSQVKKKKNIQQAKSSSPKKKSVPKNKGKKTVKVQNSSTTVKFMDLQ